MLRVAILDDHPAVLTGLERLFDRAAGLEPVVVVDEPQSLLRAVDATRPDVVVLDYALGRGDGLTLCHRLKERVLPPAVVVYSAYAGPALAIAARVAGADAVVDKRAPAGELVETVRRAGAGDAVLPVVPPELREAAISLLAPEDVPVAAMRLAGTSHQGIAEALGTDRREIVVRVRRIVGQLRPRTGVQLAAARVASQGAPSA